MIKWLFFSGILIFSTLNICAQNCADAGFDTKICGFSYNLVGTPGPGTWRYICNSDSQFVRLVTRSNRTAGVVVSGCGFYQFEYTANDTTNGCIEKDTVQLQFEDPSSGNLDVDYVFDLNYPIVLCHTANPDTCGNIRMIQGVNQPDPFWNIRVNGNCSSTNYTSNVLDKNDTNCTATFIDIKSNTKASSLQRIWRSNQDVFINLEDQGDTTIIKNNIFIGFMDLLTKSLTNNLKDSCGNINKCFELDEHCIDTVFDTTYIRLPVRIGGHWNFIGANGSTDLSKNNEIIVDGKDYILNVKPNANYYGPDDLYFEILRKNANGSLTNIDSNVNIDVYWEEDWVIDSVERILPRIELARDCKDCGRIIEDFGPMIMPTIPSFFCPTLLIKFTPGARPNLPTDTTLCGNESILLDPGEFDDYLWNDGSKSRFKNVFDTGTFKVIVSIANGCQDSATIKVRKAAIPKVVILFGDTIFCVGDTFSLFANAPEGSTFKWSNGDTSQKAIFSADITKYYIVEIKASNQCVNTDTILIHAEHGLDPIFAGNDTSLNCKINSIQLTPDSISLSEVYSFEWQGPSITSANNKTIRPVIDSPGLYILEVADSLIQCGNRDSILVVLDTVAPTFDLLSSFDTLTCLHPQAILSLVNINSRDPYTVLWMNEMNDTIAKFDNETTIRAGGTFYVEICNNITGCCNTDSIKIESSVLLLFADAGRDRILTCDTMQVQIGGENSSTSLDIKYIWNGPGLNNVDTSAKINVQLPGIYILEVRDSTGDCSVTDTVIVSSPGIIPIAHLGDDIHITCLNMIDSIINNQSIIGKSVSIEWLGPSITPQNMHDLHQGNLTEGEYILNLKDTLNGCTSSDTLIVTVNVRIPNINAGLDKIITCNFLTTKLDGRITNFRPSQKILWKGPGITMLNRNDRSPEVSEVGTYIFIVRDTSNNCESSDTVEVIALLKSATIDAGPDQSLNCNNRELTIDGSISNLKLPGYFEWTGADVNNTNKNDSSITISKEGIYILSTIYPNLKCNKMDTVIIDIDTVKPQLTLADKLTIDCNSSTLLIVATSNNINGISDIIWSSKQAFTLTNNPLQIEVKNEGIYYLILTGKNGCITSDSIEINIWEEFDFDISVDHTCGDQPTGKIYINNITGNNFPYSYSIDGSNYQSNNIIENLKANQYTIYVRDADSCVISETIQINQFDIPTWNSSIKTSCDDSLTGNITISLLSGEEPIQYSLDNNTTNTTGVFNMLEGDNNYIVHIKDNNGCVVSDTFYIPEVENFHTSIFEKIEYCNENTLVLKAIEDETLTTVRYDWGTEKDSLRTKVIRALPSIYEVTLSNACKTINKTFEISPLTVNLDTVASVPLAFTPNNDGENDSFGPIFKVNADQILTYEMRIYNRWGQIIFNTQQVGQNWDGNFNNEQAISDVYLYVINFKFDNCKEGIQSKSFKGNTTLIR